MAQENFNVSFSNDGLGDVLRNAFIKQQGMNTELYETKVDKVTGQGLSQNNYTNVEKEKLAEIEAGAGVNVQANWNQTDDTADDFIQNKPTTNNIAAYPETKFDYIDSTSFTIPDNVQAISVKINQNSIDNEYWVQEGNIITYLDTMRTGDYLLISGVYVISSGTGGSGGSIDSVNDQTGVVVLDADDIDETSNRLWLTDILKELYDTAFNWVDTNGENLLNFITNIATTIRATILTGLSTASATAIVSSDTVLSAFGKIQAQINLLLNRTFEINDSTLSSIVASTTPTLIKTYDIGFLTDNSRLFFDVRGRRVGTNNETMTFSIFLKEKTTSTTYFLGTARSGVTARYFPILRTLAIRPSENQIEVFNAGVTVTTDLVERVDGNTVYTIDYSKEYELQVFGNIGFGTTASFQSYFTNIIKR